MGKLYLVATDLPTTDKRYKKFAKLVGRKAKVKELWPGTWFVKTDERAHIIAARLSALFEDDVEDSHGEQVVVTTLGPDHEHRNGWLSSSKEAWEWLKED